MDFVTPTLLGGTVLAVVPVVLHLVMRQQPRHLEFPALRFVRQRQSANRRKLKLRHLLLLFLRTAVICLLAAALARPTIHASGVLGDQEAPVAAALVFDTSPRMDYRQQNQSRLQAAQDIGTWLVQQLPVESQVAVVDGNQGDGVFQVDLGAAKDRVGRLETSSLARPVWERIEAAARLLDEGRQDGQDLRERKELYVFTDLTRPSWEGDSSARLRELLAKDASLGIYVIDVGVA
ncbi:MAG TPA: BatA domain-containing protein, partial [Pirellulales bacterium]|nr:BatA domain-containing protein [Pirellulales bacterium]